MKAKGLFCLGHFWWKGHSLRPLSDRPNCLIKKVMCVVLRVKEVCESYFSPPFKDIASQIDIFQILIKDGQGYYLGCK